MPLWFGMLERLVTWLRAWLVKKRANGLHSYELDRMNELLRDFKEVEDVSVRDFGCSRAGRHFRILSDD